MGWREGYIAVDWGTTNRRAYLIDGAGRLADSFEDALGLMAVPAGGFEAAAADIRDRLGDRPMLLAGMVGSNRGWREAPYAPCPAGADDLAEAILWIEPGRTGIVPGVCQRGAAGADVMRGEEVQVLGAVARGLVPPDATICHPGTHAKWIVMEDGRIAAFRTMMTGELFALLSAHGILADQLNGEVRADAAFEAGVRDARAGEGILSGLFRIRARHLLGETVGEPASYASGLLIGRDVAAGLKLHRGGPLALVGRPDLCALYAAALAGAGHETTQLDGAEAFLAGMHMLTEML
ncbi:MAG: 2-dehydro-3-deoxygalactonokinase [Allosphingosinicella sp.]|uniref:2-dehydro-3-deoxygalactonokinase n=1 Tax=Allosphingosinicella sp. TaxID=2823234 RepID=UPI0039412314